MATAWTNHVLTVCMGLKPGERFMALVDQPLRGAGEALCAEAARLGAAVAALTVLPDRPTGPAVVPASFLRAVKQADVIVGLLAHLDLASEPLLLRAGVAAFHQAGTGRWANGVYVDADVLRHDLCADYGDVARRTAAWAERLTTADQVHLTTSLGTDLRFRLGGRPVHQETGLFTHPGAYGNLPAGEAFVAPLETSAEGRLVVDLCLGDIPLDRPVQLTFAGGRVVAAEGGEACRVLRRRLGSDPWAWTIGEFGVGTNPSARIRGKVTTDEKVVGTVHVALGANRGFGGSNPATTHYDCVIRASEINLDGRSIPTS